MPRSLRLSLLSLGVAAVAAFATHDVRAQRETLELDMTTYRADASGNLARLTTGRTRGRWVAEGTPHCEVPAPATPAQTGSTTATTRYRIALVARMQGATINVSAKGVRGTGHP